MATVFCRRFNRPLRDSRTDRGFGWIRQLPIRVNLRVCDLDCAGLLVVRENQSRRDLTKVAQYEVLG